MELLLKKIVQYQANKQMHTLETVPPKTFKPFKQHHSSNKHINWEKIRYDVSKRNKSQKMKYDNTSNKANPVANKRVALKQEQPSN